MDKMIDGNDPRSAALERLRAQPYHPGALRIVLRSLAGKEADDPAWADLDVLPPPQHRMTARQHLVIGLAQEVSGNLTSGVQHLLAARWDVLVEDGWAWRTLRDVLVTPPDATDPWSRRQILGTWLQGLAQDHQIARQRRLVQEALLDRFPENVSAMLDLLAHGAAEPTPADILPALDRALQIVGMPADLGAAATRRMTGLPASDLMPRLAQMSRGPHWPSHRRNLLLLAARRLDVTAIEARARRPPMRRIEGDHHVTQDGGAGVTMVVLSGMGHIPGAPFRQFDAVMASRGIRCIYLLDRDDNAYIDGGRGFQSRQQMIDWLQGQVAQTPQNRLVTLGMSMSAIAAVALGLILRADGVLSYGGVISGLLSFRDQIGDDRPNDYALRAEALAGADCDLRTWFDRHEHRPKVHMHFAEPCALDRLHAEAIAAYDNVTLRPAPGHTEHLLPSEMLLRGSFAASVDAMIDDLGR